MKIVQSLVTLLAVSSWSADAQRRRSKVKYDANGNIINLHALWVENQALCTGFIDVQACLGALFPADNALGREGKRRCKWHRKNEICYSGKREPRRTNSPTNSPTTPHPTPPTSSPTASPTTEWSVWEVETDVCDPDLGRRDCLDIKYPAEHKFKNQKRCKYKQNQCVPRNMNKPDRTPGPTASPITAEFATWSTEDEKCRSHLDKKSCGAEKFPKIKGQPFAGKSKCSWNGQLGCTTKLATPPTPAPTAPTPAPTPAKQLRPGEAEWLEESTACAVGSGSEFECKLIEFDNGKKRCKWSGSACLPRKLTNPYP